MLEEKTLACAQQFHSAVSEIHFHLFHASPITVNHYGGRTLTLTPDAWFVGAKLSEVEGALQKHSTDPDRLFPILIRIDQDIRNDISLLNPEQPMGIGPTPLILSRTASQ